MTSEDQDVLALFRACIATRTPPIPTTSSDASSSTDTADLSTATHLLFNTQSAATGAHHSTFSLTAPTRFISSAHGALDLLSVYFCWLNKEKGVGDYISATQSLNAERAAHDLSNVRNLVFVEKLDLVNWLSGDVAENESEFIKSLDDNSETRRLALDAAALVSGDGDVAMGEAGSLALGTKAGGREDERLREIYAMERKVGDRNTVLRGIKPTDFSHVRKYTDLFLRRAKQPAAPTAALSAPTPALRSKPSSGRRPEPIILLSPSASSLLRLSNIKSFLTDGVYTPPTSTSSGLNILHLNRALPSVDPSRPLRFILVETPDNFKPDYWSRVVAVFTTGQAWQFKGYKWQDPAELFAHALGVYVGWRNEIVPDSVKGWGRSVLPVAVDKWREGQVADTRWRDRETVEEVWSAIEAGMRARGWGKEGR